MTTFAQPWLSEDEVLFHRMEVFHRQQVNAIASGQSPLGEREDGVLVVHFIPRSCVHTRTRFDGAKLATLLAMSAARRGTGFYLAGSGAPATPDPQRTYLVATTDFIAHNAASPYRALFEGAEPAKTPPLTKTVTEIVEAHLNAAPAREWADGRIHSPP